MMDGLAALTSVNMKDVQRSAEEFHHDFPQVDPKNLKWGERLFLRSARDAYTLSLMRSKKDEIRSLGARPCVRCGEITCSWCEGCTVPQPWALCSRCDEAGILCPRCTSENKLWHLVKRMDEPGQPEGCACYCRDVEFSLNVLLVGCPNHLSIPHWVSEFFQHEKP